MSPLIICVCMRGNLEKLFLQSTSCTLTSATAEMMSVGYEDCDMAFFSGAALRTNTFYFYLELIITKLSLHFTVFFVSSLLLST